jgi:hypothetical protein
MTMSVGFPGREYDAKCDTLASVAVSYAMRVFGSTTRSCISVFGFHNSEQLLLMHKYISSGMVISVINIVVKIQCSLWSVTNKNQVIV